MSTTTKTPLLGDPLQIARGPVIANRLARAALSEGLADRGGKATPELIRLYRRWAQEGGHGLILTGAVMIDRRHLGEPGNVVIEDDQALDQLSAWADAAQSGGARVWMQINHAGRQALALLSGNRPVAPSAIRPDIPGASKPRALKDTEIRELIQRFATTATIAKTAGFDGVQFHGAHGYLISQFLSPLSNQRTDEWGGDPERRMAFLLAILHTTREAVGPDFPLGIKLNSADFQRGGFQEADSMAVVEALAEHGIDLVEISGGTYGAPAMMGKMVRESTRQREAYFQDYAEEVRRRVPGLPLMLTGGLRTRDAMQGALDDGACDLVGIGRAPCVNPAVGTELLNGTREHAPAGDRRTGARWLIGRLTDLRPIDGAIDLQWHTDQMHRMGQGKDPDPDRAWYRTLARMLRRNGLAALTRKRS